MFPLDDVIMWDCSPDVTPYHSRDRPPPPPPPPQKKKIVILIMLFCTSGPNLMIVAWMDGELLHGQSSSSKLSKILLKIKFDLEGEVRLCPKMTINQLVLHLRPKFGDHNLHVSQVITWTNSWLTHGWTHPHKRRWELYLKARAGFS